MVRSLTTTPLPVLLLLAAPVGAYEVVWNSWYPTECRAHGDTTTAADFKRFGISFDEGLTPGIPALRPQVPSNDTGHATDRVVLFYENFGRLRRGPSVIIPLKSPFYG